MAIRVNSNRSFAMRTIKRGFQNQMYLFDVLLQQWMKIQMKTSSDVVENRSSHASVGADSELLIFGGINENSLLGANLFRVKIDHKEMEFGDILSMSQKLQRTGSKFKKNLLGF